MSKFPVVYPPGPLKKRYTVSCYDRWEYPDDDCWYDQGEFDSPAEAIACANRVIRKSLEHLRQQKPRADAKELLDQFHHFGEVPVIRGEPKVPFDPYLTARWYARAITARSAAAA